MTKLSEIQSEAEERIQWSKIRHLKDPFAEWTLKLCELVHFKTHCSDDDAFFDLAKTLKIELEE